MRIEAIQELYDAQPFAPFTIRTTGGRDYPVPHREFMAISPDGSAIIVFTQRGGAIFLDLGSVESVGTGNGSEPS